MALLVAAVLAALQVAALTPAVALAEHVEQRPVQDPQAADVDLDAVRRAAEQGDVDAQYNLGIRYAAGWGVPEDHAEAMRWYRLPGRAQGCPGPRAQGRQAAVEPAATVCENCLGLRG